MEPTELNRRDFSRLTAAAFGGMLAGTMAGCSDQPSSEAPTTPDDNPGGTAPEAANAGKTSNFLLGELHVCRGMNTCQGQGSGGKNQCAGQGACATIEAHFCAGQNNCKGQGGCGAEPALNACKGQGGCSIPMHAGAWEKARAAFEERMQAENKTFGAAPPRPEEG